MRSLIHNLSDQSWPMLSDAFDITADPCNVGTMIGLKNNPHHTLDRNNQLTYGTTGQMIIDCDSILVKDRGRHPKKLPLKLAQESTNYFIGNTKNLKYIDVDHLSPVKLTENYEWEMTSLPMLTSSKADSTILDNSLHKMQTAVAELPIDKTTDWTSSLSAMIKAAQMVFFYIAEEEEYGDYIKGYETVAQIKTNTAINLISNLSYDKITLELTPDCSIIFNIHRSDDIKIFVEVYFNPSEGESKEAYFAYYVGHNCIRNGMGTLENVIKDVQAL